MKSAKLCLQTGNLHWRLRGSRYAPSNLAVTLMAVNVGSECLSSLRVSIRAVPHCTLLGKSTWYVPTIAPKQHTALGEFRVCTLEDQCVLEAHCSFRCPDPWNEDHNLLIPGSDAVGSGERLLFVSYRSTDLPLMSDLLRRLQALPVRVWIAQSDLNVGGGDWFPQEIRGALERACIFLPILSTAAVCSPWVLEEIRLAGVLRAAGRLCTMIPIAIEKCVPPAAMAADEVLHYDPATADVWPMLESRIRAALIEAAPGSKPSF